MGGKKPRMDELLDTVDSIFQVVDEGGQASVIPALFDTGHSLLCAGVRWIQDM